MDTSIISHLYALDSQEKMEDTLRFWKLLQEGRYDIVLSEVVFIEIADCYESKKIHLERYLQQIQYETIKLNDEIISLTNKLINYNILTNKNLKDCNHIATALLSNCDIIAIPPKPEEPLRHAIPSTGVKFPIMMLNIRWNCYIVSWNFKHMVNLKIIDNLKRVLSIESFKNIVICSPSVLIGE